MGKPEDKSEEEYASALQWVMSAPNGRMFVHHLFDRLGLLKSGFRTPHPSIRQEERLVFNGSRRDFAMEVYDDAMKYAPSELDRMQLEARERALTARGRQQEKKNEEEQKDGDEAAA